MIQGLEYIIFVLRVDDKLLESGELKDIIISIAIGLFTEFIPGKNNKFLKKPLRKIIHFLSKRCAG